MTIDSRLPNFRTLTPAQRLEHIAKAASLSDEEIALIARPGALNIERTGVLVGTIEMPMDVGLVGGATNLKFLSFRSHRRSPKCPSLLWNIAARRPFFASFCSH